jgi:hypothetical protein
MPEASSPFVFVVGCPRSGTTLLQRMLDSHPLLAVANDTHFIVRCLEKLAPQLLRAAQEGAPVPLGEHLVAGARGYHRFARLGLSDAQVARAAAGASTWAGFVRALYEEFAGARRKRLGGEKTPDFVRHVSLLHGLFPQAAFVHIIRDGRDVALSLRDWATDSKGPGRLELWSQEPIGVAALWWQWQVTAGRAQGAVVGPRRYLEVPYENLVADPRRHLQSLCAFLELPFAAPMLDYHCGRARDKEGLSAKSAWLPPTPGLRDWRTQMRRRDLELFEALAGDVLGELGYERAIASVGPEAARAAARCRAWWCATLERREQRRRRRAAGA